MKKVVIVMNGFQLSLAITTSVKDTKNKKIVK